MNLKIKIFQHLSIWEESLELVESLGTFNHRSLEAKQWMAVSPALPSVCQGLELEKHGDNVATLERVCRQTLEPPQSFNLPNITCCMSQRGVRPVSGSEWHDSVPGHRWGPLGLMKIVEARSSIPKKREVKVEGINQNMRGQRISNPFPDSQSLHSFSIFRVTYNFH